MNPAQQHNRVSGHLHQELSGAACMPGNDLALITRDVVETDAPPRRRAAPAN